MFFRIKRSYKSSMNVDQVYQFLGYLSSRESSIWKFKSKTYNVKVDGLLFSIKKRGGSANGPVYPLIKGKITQNDFVQIDLDIEPAYSIIISSFLAGFTGLFFILSDEKMTINNVFRAPTLLERIGMGLFVIAIPAVISYFKTIQPVQNAEEWLISKLKLEPITH